MSLPARSIDWWLKPMPIKLAIRILCCSAAALIIALAVGGPTDDAGAYAARQEPATAWRVVIKPLTPFVMETDGAYRGFSIDLWREGIAARLGQPYEYQFVETVADQLAAVENGAANLAITGISITKAREEVLDFSQPYFRAGLQMLTRTDNGAEWTAPFAMLRAMVLSSGFLSIVGGPDAGDRGGWSRLLAH